MEAQRAGGQLWEENSLWEVAGGLLPPTSLNLHPGRGSSISKELAGGRLVLQNLIMCTDVLPNVPALLTLIPYILKNEKSLFVVIFS